MGCHTWIYKDVEKLTPKEYRMYIVDEFLKHSYIPYNYFKIGDESIKDIYINFKKEAEEYTELDKDNPYYSFYMKIKNTSLEDLIKERKELVLKDINTYKSLLFRPSGISKTEFLKIFKDTSILYQSYKKRIYVNINDGGDSFRVSGYPERRFISYSSLIKWLYKRYKHEYFCYFDEKRNNERILNLDKNFREKLKCLFRRHNNNILISFG